MKPSLATNSDILHLYPNRNYVSLSNKLSSGNYIKSTAYNFNSPKNESTKILFSSKPTSNETSKILKKTEKYEPTLDRKGSRSNNDPTPNQPKFSSTYTSFTGSPRFNPSPKVGLLDEKRSSVDKSKNGTHELYSSMSKYGSTPKASDSMNLRDALKNDGGYSRPKNLEISTEFSSSRIATVNKVQPYTTKHRDSSEKIPQNEAYKKNSVNTYSFEFISKFSKNPTNSTNSTEPNEDKNLTSFGKQPVRTSTIVPKYSSYAQPEKTSYAEQDRSSPTKKYQTEIQYGSSITSNKNSSTNVKINNFFNSTGMFDASSSKQADKSLNRTSKIDYDTYEDSVARSADLSKKTFSKTQLDLKTTLRGISNEPDSRKEQAEYSRANKEALSSSQTMKNETPSNKNSGLNSFVTKVDRGMFSSAISKPTEKEESGSRKPYLTLEDKTPKNSTPKNSTSGTYSNTLYKSTKTTTNQDSKTISFNNTTSTSTSSNNNTSNKYTTSLTSSNQDSAKRGNSSNSKVSKPSTPSNRAASKDGHELNLTPTTSTSSNDKKTLLYYTAFLDKYHRSYIDNDYFCQIYREHFMQTYQAMMFCKYLKPVDPKVLAQKRVFLNKRESCKDKKTLVFDLDETLIHCNESADMPCDVKLPIRFPHGEIIEAGINVRPYVIECLKELSQYYEIVVFTASHGCYANVVLDYLDPKEQYIHHRLFRESCVQTEEGIYIKDLRVLANRNLQDLILVDNAAYSFGYQIENGIPIVPFYDNKADQELRHLVPYLKYLAGMKDLRDFNKQYFKLHTYGLYDSPDKVLEKVVIQK